MKRTPLLCALALVALSPVPGCSRDGSRAGNAEAQASAGNATTAVAAPSTPTMKTKHEKVTMNGIAWEVTMPEGMRAPEYKVTDPEYLSDHIHLGLTNSFPKFASADSYAKNNVSTKVLDKEQVGDATLLVIAPQASQDADEAVYVQAIVPGQTIGWTCSGPQNLEADVRAMCRSVKFRKV